MPTRSPGHLAAALLLRFPTTVVLLSLLAFYTLTAFGLVPLGPIAQVVVLPVVVGYYLVDPVGALATRWGLPFSDALQVGLLVLGALAVDWALRRATQ